MRHVILALTVFLLLGSLLLDGLAQPPVGWRGDGTGIFATSPAPTQWSQTKNVRWKTPTLAWSNASPIVVGDFVFICEEPVTLVCVNRKNGEVVWRRENTFIETVSQAERKKWEEKLRNADALEASYEQERRGINRLKQKARRQKVDKALKSELQNRLSALNEMKKSLDKLTKFRRPTPKPNIVGTSSPTPISDGKFVYVFFGNGVASKFSLTGERMWSTWLGPATTGMEGYDEGVAASPRLIGTLLLVGYEGLRALETSTGKERWKTPVFKDFGTPLLTTWNGRSILITASGEALDIDDGLPVNDSKLPRLRYTGPVQSEDVLFSAGTNQPKTERRRERAARLQLPAENSKASITAYRLVNDSSSAKADILFRVPLPGERYYATALAHGQYIYTVEKRGILTVVDTKSGTVILEKHLVPDPIKKNQDAWRGAEVFASPAFTNGHIYISFDSGISIALESTPPFKTLATNYLEPGRASLFFYEGDLFIRTLNALYCIREKR